jgi:RNase P subunit RPR2
MPAGSLVGPTMMKSLYITSRRFYAMTFSHEFVFQRARMYQRDIDVAIFRQLQRLACTNCDDVYLGIGFRFKYRQDVRQQTGVVGACGGR